MPASRLAPHASPQDRPPAIQLMGPTASGKSALALELANRFPLEIVSVDSAQVYRHMNIGTAKPDTATQQKVPHHLIDLIEPVERYSAARFRDDALAAMRDIAARGRTPLLVGGTMLYFKALLEGLSELPAANAGIRGEIDAMARNAGWPGVHVELARIDPRTAARLDPNDAQRIQRALEIFRLTGRPMSELVAQVRGVELPFRLIALGLAPQDRAVLHRRISGRFDTMLALGLIDEVRGLRANFALDMSLPSMRCVGYRQVWEYLDGEFDREALREKAAAATRQLAKRQLTWLRSMTEIAVFDCLAGNLHQQAGEWLKRELDAPSP
jgi:tRNA dimethylallyltransferase